MVRMKCRDHVVLLDIKRAESFNYQPLIKREVIYIFLCALSAEPPIQQSLTNSLVCYYCAGGTLLL